jgi:hypothetical protein
VLDAGVGKMRPGLIMAALVINKAQRHFLVSARHLALYSTPLSLQLGSSGKGCCGFLGIPMPTLQAALSVH